jgi:hypothetical protein
MKGESYVRGNHYRALFVETFAALLCAALMAQPAEARKHAKFDQPQSHVAYESEIEWI